MLVTEPVVVQDLAAVTAIRASRDEELKAEYMALTAPHPLAAVASGRKLASVSGDSVPHPNHAALAKADLERYAKLLFPEGSQYTDVMTMIGAFRRAYAAVYVSLAAAVPAPP